MTAKVAAATLISHAVMASVRGAERTVAQLARDVTQSIGDYERLGFTIKASMAREQSYAEQQAGRLKSVRQAYEGITDGADKYLKSVQNFSLTRPVTEKHTAGVFKILAGYQLGTKASLDWTKALIDFALATGREDEEVQRLALALGQLKAKGKLMGEEMRQFTNAGISMDMFIAGLNKRFPKLTVNAGNFYKMMKQGALTTKYVLPALFDQLDQFSEMGKDLATNWAGIPILWENIQRVVNRNLFGPVFKEIGRGLGGFIEMFDPEKHPNTVAGFENVGKAIGQVINPAIDDMIGKLPMLNNFFIGMAQGGTGWNAIYNAFSNAMGKGMKFGVKFSGKDVLDLLTSEFKTPTAQQAAFSTGQWFGEQVLGGIFSSLWDITTFLPKKVFGLLTGQQLTGGETATAKGVGEFIKGGAVGLARGVQGKFGVPENEQTTWETGMAGWKTWLDWFKKEDARRYDKNMQRNKATFDAIGAFIEGDKQRTKNNMQGFKSTTDDMSSALKPFTDNISKLSLAPHWENALKGWSKFFGDVGLLLTHFKDVTLVEWWAGIDTGMINAFKTGSWLFPWSKFFGDLGIILNHFFTVTLPDWHTNTIGWLTKDLNWADSLAGWSKFISDIDTILWSGEVEIYNSGLAWAESFLNGLKRGIFDLAPEGVRQMLGIEGWGPSAFPGGGFDYGYGKNTQTPPRGQYGSYQYMTGGAANALTSLDYSATPVLTLDSALGAVGTKLETTIPDAAGITNQALVDLTVGSPVERKSPSVLEQTLDAIAFKLATLIPAAAAAGAAALKRLKPPSWMKSGGFGYYQSPYTRMATAAGTFESPRGGMGIGSGNEYGFTNAETASMMAALVKIAAGEDPLGLGLGGEDDDENGLGGVNDKLDQMVGKLQSLIDKAISPSGDQPRSWAMGTSMAGELARDAWDEPARRWADIAKLGKSSPWFEGMRGQIPADIIDEGGGKLAGFAAWKQEQFYKYPMLSGADPQAVMENIKQDLIAQANQAAFQSEVAKAMQASPEMMSLLTKAGYDPSALGQIVSSNMGGMPLPMGWAGLPGMGVAGAGGGVPGGLSMLTVTSMTVGNLTAGGLTPISGVPGGLSMMGVPAGKGMSAPMTGDPSGLPFNQMVTDFLGVITSNTYSMIRLLAIIATKKSSGEDGGGGGGGGTGTTSYKYFEGAGKYAGGHNAARGLTGIVPPGYPNDSYRMLLNLTSGEPVTVGRVNEPKFRPRQAIYIENVNVSNQMESAIFNGMVDRRIAEAWND